MLKTLDTHVVTMPETRLPEDTKSPLLFLKKEEKPEKPPLLSLDGLRLDKRQWNEIRSLSIQNGVVHNTTGSAYIELGATKILCSVVGPREVARREEFSMKGQILCQLKYAPFSCKLRKPVQQEEKQLSLIIGEAMMSAVKLESFPKLQIEVNILVLENGGSILTGAVLCVSVALVTSGIEMRDIPIACTVSYSGQTFLCDPSLDEEYDPSQTTYMTKSTLLSGHQTIIYLPSFQEICGIYQVGHLELDISPSLVEVCVEGCLRIHDHLRKFLHNINSE